MRRLTLLGTLAFRPHCLHPLRAAAARLPISAVMFPLAFRYGPSIRASEQSLGSTRSLSPRRNDVCCLPRVEGPVAFTERLFKEWVCSVHLKHDLCDRWWSCNELNPVDVVHEVRATQVHKFLRGRARIDRFQPRVDAVDCAKALKPLLHPWIEAVVEVPGRQREAHLRHTALHERDWALSRLQSRDEQVSLSLQMFSFRRSSLALQWLCCATVKARSRLRWASPP